MTAPTPEATPPTPPPAPPTGTPPAAAPPAPPAAPDWDGKVESLPKGVQDLVQNLRTENAQKRTAARDATKAAQTQLADALKAFGIDVPSNEDPVKIAELAAAERDQAKTQLRDALAEQVVWRAAAELGVNAAAVTDSRGFERAIVNLDPAADDFADKVKAAAKTAADNNAALKATPAVPGKGGADFSGGTGEGAHDLDAQIEAATKAGDHKRAISLKRQKAYQS